MRLHVFWILLLLIIPVTIAQTGRVTLLAVSEGEDGKLKGTTADLFLEVKDGQGRVFIESSPLTKIDTQISTRFAKDIACNYIEADCDNLDFFYTISSDSAIIGGPSAGAAISLLTSSVLLDLSLDENITITGTINSGEIIGPVGAVAEKVRAAGEAGLSKVLLPAGEEMALSNLTFEEKMDFPDFVFVSTLDDAMFEFTGRRKVYVEPNFTLSPAYQDTMRLLATDLCTRAERIKKEYDDTADLDQLLAQSDKIIDAQNQSRRGKAAFDEGSYYSAASQCFGAGVAYREMLLGSLGLEEEDMLLLAKETGQEIEDFDLKVEQVPLRTITDLQAYMIVKERIREARDNINSTLESINQSPYHDLAFGIERLHSAELWADFFGGEGKQFQLDKEVLRASCVQKIGEAQERYHYSTAYMPGTLKDTLQQIERAREDYESGDYALCLFKASKAKAEADLLLNVISINPDMVDNLIDQKINVAKGVIARSSEKEIFPIVGYSYYEYAKNLKDYDKYSALLYAEYALELSNFDVYFAKEYKKTLPIRFDAASSMAFFIGFITGILFTLALVFPRKKKNSDR